MKSRQTKFRAWTGSEMIMVQTLCFNDKGCLWFGKGTHMGWAFTWPNAEWTADDPKPDDNDLKPVMQFTGLMDKNGRDIYEGDILKTFNTRCYYEVVFNDNQESFAQYTGFKLKVHDKEGDLTKDRVIFQRFSNGPESFHYEVIGNIYQTPELLNPN